MSRLVDVELRDMAEGMGMSLHRLMTGVKNGRFDRVADRDLVRGDKGDPLFFRIEEERAYAIFGANAPGVAKDMSTVERMSKSDRATGDRANAPGETTAISSPDRSTEDGQSQEAEQRQETGQVQETGQGQEARDDGREQEGGSALSAIGGMALLFGGAYALSQVNRGLTEGEKDRIWQEGYNGYFQGVNANPYHLDTEAAEVYKRGWVEAREESLRRIIERMQRAPLPN